MASKRFALVSEQWYEKAMKETPTLPSANDFIEMAEEPKHTVNILEPPIRPDQQETEKVTKEALIHEPLPENVGSQPKKTDLAALASMLPNSMKSRAKIMARYLSDLKLTDTDRVIYEDSTIGSNIIDLMRYALSPFYRSRPLDWPQFSQLIKKYAVPESILAQRINGPVIQTMVKKPIVKAIQPVKKEKSKKPTTSKAQKVKNTTKKVKSGVSKRVRQKPRAILKNWIS